VWNIVDIVMNNLLIDTKDYRGKRVIFTKRKWKRKRKDHPELSKKEFIEAIEKTINEPIEVWPDYNDSNKKRCYYRKYSATSYIKVVVWFKESPCQVVTSYEIDYIKESNYLKLKRIK